MPHNGNPSAHVLVHQAQVIKNSSPCDTLSQELHQTLVCPLPLSCGPAAGTLLPVSGCNRTAVCLRFGPDVMLWAMTLACMHPHKGWLCCSCTFRAELLLSCEDRDCIALATASCVCVATCWWGTQTGHQDYDSWCLDLAFRPLSCNMLARYLSWLSHTGSSAYLVQAWDVRNSCKHNGAVLLLSAAPVGRGADGVDAMAL
jgi:hypothetical protein